MNSRWVNCPECYGRGCGICHRYGQLLRVDGRPATWVTRTVRDGAVTIYRGTFRPDETHRKYRDEFEGMRLVFALYTVGTHPGEGRDFLPFVALWGAKAESDRMRAGDDDWCTHDTGIKEPDGNVVLPWGWWQAEGIRRRT